TAARYELPICIVLYNNSAWVARNPRPGDNRPYHFQMNLRYDRLAEALGCHGEFVESPEEIGPALERAFASGRPSLLNVIVHPTASTGIYGAGRSQTLKVRFY
ncbi:MAG TPA: thiamine pyrophosphate-dependent enzyme, partial [Dehalococcoidia bacterium]|nr:thiamine pyrophosphate-dependent enzyme [Dehalococcoidia bacterium]